MSIAGFLFSKPIDDGRPVRLKDFLGVPLRMFGLAATCCAIASVLVTWPLVSPAHASGWRTPVPPSKNLRVPVREMTMGNVRHIFGAPKKILPAVGNPPITRWIYPDFIVYFERKLVIHTVITNPREAPPLYIQSGATSSPPAADSYGGRGVMSSQ